MFKVKDKILIGLAGMVMFVAQIAVVPTSLGLWHQPKVPRKLQG